MCDKNIIYNIYKLNRKYIALILKTNSSFIIKKIIYVEDLQIYIYYIFIIYMGRLQDNVGLTFRFLDLREWLIIISQAKNMDR